MSTPTHTVSPGGNGNSGSSGSPGSRPPLPDVGPGSFGSSAAGVAVLGVLVLAIIVVGLWHLTQGTSGAGMQDLLRLLTGARETVGGCRSAMC